MDKIYVIIPFFDGWRQLKTCLDALRASTYRELEIIVVNHSNQGEFKEALSAQYPEVMQIPAQPTLWWAGATNVGIRAALDRAAKRIMLLNHDCYVEPETIQKIAAYAEEFPEALIAPVPVDYLTKRALAVTARTCFLLGFPTLSLPGKYKQVGQGGLVQTRLILGGRGVLIPAALFKRLGLFDESNLPHYYSDHDFYLRCRERGVPLFVAGDVKVYIDDTSTTLARRLEEMTARDFVQTLVDPRSHRNIRDLTAIFKFHYPIKGLHHIGVALNLIRYSMLFAWKRLQRALGAVRRRQEMKGT